jgi:hypothetical protein
VSTILKALKRLDEQRRADAAPRTLEEQVLAGGSPPSADPDARRRKWLLSAIGASSALLVVVFALTLREDAPVAKAAPPAVAAQPVDLGEAIARAPRGSVPSRGAPVAGTALDSEVREGLLARGAHGETARAAGAASALPAAGHQPEPGVGLEANPALGDAAPARDVAAAPPPEEMPRFEVQSARDAAPVSAPVPAVQASEPPAPEAAPASPSDATREPEPEVAVVTGRPEVWVERTQWHPTPAKRSALVRVGQTDEAHELHEGEALGGVVVKEIRPSGVLFLYEGEEFKRGVGGS